MANHIVTRGLDGNVNFTNLDCFPVISFGVEDDGTKRNYVELRTFCPSVEKDSRGKKGDILVIWPYLRFYEESPNYDSIRKYLAHGELIREYKGFDEILK